jgi:hypothetical protein
MKKLLVLALLLMAIATFAQDGWYYDEASGLYATSDGYYYYFYEPYNDFYFAYDPSIDMYYYFDAASGMFYPYGTSDTTYTSYDDYSDGDYYTSYDDSGYETSVASGGSGMNQACYDIMYDTMMDSHVTSMNIINNMDSTSDVDYYYYDSDY